MQHADVVVIPHLVNPFTESLDPIKAYECLAAGRPTVATPVAGFRELGPPIVIADRSRFVDGHRRPPWPPPMPPGAPEPRAIARSPRGCTHPTWHDRAEAMAAVMDTGREPRAGSR